MCGIAGIVTKNNSNEYKKITQKMVGAIAHRGPDENGLHTFRKCSLGHARLSIVDLSAGQQPMLARNNSLGIVFNGEIYGYKKIKESIKDYVFKNNSDTEVILALYESYGSKLLDKLPGIFSFAIWDDDTEELFCARDRFGEKPFFYALGKNNEFIFASEIKAILATGLVDPILDKKSLVHYLKHLYVNPYKTIYTNVFTLPPAHSLLLKDGQITVERYWSIPPTNEAIGLEEATEKFKKLFNASVESQLVADVPVGAFLSGGLDSSTVVAVASLYKKNLKTFSFSFENSTNELPFAREIAKKYETEHTELFDSSFNIAELMVETGQVFDEPFADSSNIPTFLISKLAKKHVTVVLTGDGGDELLGGYGGWYKPLLYANDGTKSLSPWAAVMASYIVKAFYKFHLPHKDDLGLMLAGNNLKQKFSSILDAHEFQNTYFSDEELDSILINKVDSDKYQPYWKSTDTLDDVMKMDVDNYMPGDILTKIDRASMANGLELRAPFLDVELASFCLSLSYRLKIDRKTEKILLRQAFAKSWTKSIEARKKQGFGAPVNKWLKLPEVKILKETYLGHRDKNIYQLFSFTPTQEFVNKDNYQTWILLVLAIWLENKDMRMIEE